MIFSKRAEAKMVLPPIFIAALGLGVVFLSILYAIMGIGTNETYLRQLYLTSLGLELQSLQGMGNDINAERDITDAGAYDLVFEGTQVYTRERGVQTNTFMFTHVPGFRFHGGEFAPEKDKTIGPLKLYKVGNEYGVAKPDEVPSPYVLNCDTPTGNPLKTIALDPGHGYDQATGEGNTGEYIASFSTEESKYTLLLANTVSAGRTRYELTRSKETDSYATINARKSTTGNAIISLHVGSRTDSADFVKAYYGTKKGSQRLACEILNEITKELRIPVRLVPVNFEYLPDDDAKQVIKTSRPAVLLEIGNAQKIQSILTKTGPLALAINRGVENYGVE